MSNYKRLIIEGEKAKGFEKSKQRWIPKDPGGVENSRLREILLIQRQEIIDSKYCVYYANDSGESSDDKLYWHKEFSSALGCLIDRYLNRDKATFVSRNLKPEQEKLVNALESMLLEAEQLDS